MDLQRFPRHRLTFGDTPIEKLERLSAHLGGKVEIYAKREDCNSGLAFGGNKLHAGEIIKLPGVRQIRTFFVLKEILSTTELPL